MRPRDEARALGELWVVVERPHEAVHDDEPPSAAGQRERQADRPAEVVNDERERLEPEAVYERAQVLCVVFGSIAEIDGPLGQPEAQVIGRDAAIVPRQLADQMPVLEGPGGRAVHEQDRLARALVDVVHAAARKLEEAALEGVGVTVEPARGGFQRDGHSWQKPPVSAEKADLGIK